MSHGTAEDCNVLKRLKKVMNEIKDLGSKIVFLQETHLLEEDEKKSQKEVAG